MANFQQSLSDAARLLRKARSRTLRLIGGEALISLVVPCYNVARYIDDFTQSLVSQKGGLRGIEVIFVNDGSTDDTLDKLNWAIGRLGRDKAKLISKVNGGVSSARNAGLDAARGTWVTFTDPDDMLDAGYFEAVRAGMDERPKIAFVATRLVRYYEKTGETLDDHRLTYRFKRPITAKPATDLGPFIHLASNSAFYRVDLVRSNALTFDERIKPGFEDAHFTNRYLIRCPQGSEAVFLRDAVYLYRKRADESSLQDRARTRKEYWLDQTRYGWLALLEDAHVLLGYVPGFVQRTVLYDVVGQIHILLGSAAAPRGLSPEERLDYSNVLSRVFSFIDSDQLENGPPGLFEEYKVALTKTFYPDRLRPLTGYLTEWDPTADLGRVLIFSPEADDTSIPKVNGSVVPKLWQKRIRRQVLDRDWLFEHTYWIRLGDRVQIADPSGTALQLKVTSQAYGDTITRGDIAKALFKRAANPDGSQLWLLMDRSDKADDNAEHLYRYLAQHRPVGVRIGFVLERSSADWTRLAAEGLNLIAYKTDAHRAALGEATIVASSRADPHILQPFPDLPVTNRFVFLQHGVMNQDQSRWLNKIAPNLIVTAGAAEYDSFTAQDTPYRLTTRHVALTGFPRHDALLAGAGSAERSIFIMPTWRRYLGLANEKTWSVRPEFYDSIYVRKWRELLNSAALRAAADSIEATIEFCVHPNFAAYAGAFAPPSHVTVVDTKEVPSFQTHLRNCAAFVTDYSPIAFDAAYAGKRVVYFQFDRSDYFGGLHLNSEGDFDFDRDGFGPVALDVDQAMGAIADAVSGRGSEVYNARRDAYFAFRDQMNCKRVTDALVAMTVGNQPV